MITWLLMLLPAAALAQDDAVAQAVARYRAGDFAAAAQLLHPRLQQQSTLAPDDRLRANTYMALALIGNGDLTAAQKYAAAALDQEPCLHLAEGTSQKAVDLFDRVRPLAGWCSINPQSATLASLAVPGFTHALTRNPIPAVALFAGSVAGVGAGIWLISSSGDTYDHYLQAASGYEAETLYRSAQLKRIGGAAALGAGLAIWTINVIDARRTAVRRQQRIREVRSYALEAVPISPGTVGIGVRFSLGNTQ
jgi:hypothetical protein